MSITYGDFVPYVGATIRPCNMKGCKEKSIWTRKVTYTGVDVWADGEEKRSDTRDYCDEHKKYIESRGDRAAVV